MRYGSTIQGAFKVVSTAGNEFQCICPWHQDRSGHLYINGVSGLYLCMVCGKKGSLERDSPRPVALGSDDVREKMRRMEAKRVPQHVYPESWLAKFNLPHDYWEQERNLTPDIISQFNLGYDYETDRVTIPLRDVDGRILGVTGRALDSSKPKYKHPKGFPIGKHLFGAWLVTDQTRVALVEGQMDAIRCWSVGVPALALMGARLTDDQRKVLQRLGVQTVALMLDNDEAGYRGTISVAETLEKSGIRVVVGKYRDYWFDSEGYVVKDPDGLNGSRLRKMYHSATTVYEWAKTLNGA